MSDNTKEKVIIPNNSIRVRFIANSNSDKDQNDKLLIKNDVNKELINMLKDVKSINDARIVLNNNINNIDNLINQSIIKNKINTKYKLNFGMNYFPQKEYKGVKYNEGNYESLVITLGEGKGENFWCVLFPPLCFDEVEKNDLDEVEYKSFIKELINKFF